MYKFGIGPCCWPAISIPCLDWTSGAFCPHRDRTWAEFWTHFCLHRDRTYLHIKQGPSVALTTSGSRWVSFPGLQFIFSCYCSTGRRHQPHGSRVTFFSLSLWFHFLSSFLCGHFLCILTAPSLRARSRNPTLISTAFPCVSHSCQAHCGTWNIGGQSVTIVQLWCISTIC